MDSGGTHLDVHSSSSFPCSSTTPRWSYDVFLSFRGEDTRKNFIDHLYMALVQSGINTFRDDDELPRGHEISSELLKAIQVSRISIVVFSKNYGNSRWCLDELVKIMECRKTIRKLVLPVFYDVDPSEVRKQTGNFQDAFAKHEERFRTERQKLETWRAALIEASNLSGWDLQNLANGYEAKFIRRLVERVLQEANHTCLHVAKYPVGLDSHAEELNSLICSGTRDVLLVAICGMGGIGKTTITKHFYNSVFRQYEASCFLSNVREECEKPNGILHLQEKLISEILMQKKVKIANVDSGISLLKQRLRSRRVLIVLDDLDQLDQLDSLAGDRNWFGKGSLVIITTRNEQLADQAEVDVKYEVEELNYKESVTLFCWHAFKRPVPLESYSGLLEDIVTYAGGLPLALEIIGASLFKKTILEWKSMLEKLKVIPHNEIQAKLKISFEALDDDTVKDIFLDIACFFIGMEKGYAIQIFDACGFFGDIGISTLMSRSLLKISSVDTLIMHDLVRDMGRGIVRESFPKELGKHTRLWGPDDVLEVLSTNKGTKSIEGVILDLATQKHFSTRTFARMPNLRLLQINNVYLEGSFKGLFKELKWLCWHGCALDSLPSDLHLQKLVCLDMQKSNLRILWSGTKFLSNLKIMDLRESRFLTTTPDFSGVRNLEELRFNKCGSLSNIDKSIGLLDKLITLDLGYCHNLRSLPSTISDLGSLETLDVSFCSELEGLPEMLGDMKHLRSINASECGIRELPDSIGNLCQLKSLRVDGCKSIRSLPDNICNLKSLESLSLFDCPNLKRLPEQLGDMEGLEQLLANRSGIKQLPLSVGLLHNLSDLSFETLTLTVTEFVWLLNLTCLEHLCLKYCNLSDGDIPDNLQALSLLKNLNLSGNYFCSLPSSLAQLSNLGTLILSGCKSLHSILDLPPNLSTISANDCTSLAKLPDLSNFHRLKRISLKDCKKLLEIRGLPNLKLNIIHMNLAGCCSSLSELILFQVPSEQVLFSELCLPRQDIPDFFEYQEIGGSVVSFDVPLHVPDYSFHSTIWLDYERDDLEFGYISILIHQKTDDSKWSHDVHMHYGVGTRGSCVIQVPHWYQIKSGDSIDVSFEPSDSYLKVGKCGVHLALISV